MTYGQLRANASRIVRSLDSAGFRRNDRIIIIMPNGPRLAVALACIASGFTAIPLNSEYRPTEYERYLSALRPKALLTLAGTMQHLKRIACDIGLEAIDLAASGSPEEGPFALSYLGNTVSGDPDFTKPEDTVLVLLTSGTTAMPKRIPLTNRNLQWGVHYCDIGAPLGTNARLLFIAHLFHAGVVIVLWRAFSNGGASICAEDIQPSDFFDFLDRTKATQYFVTPTELQQILERADDHRDVITRSKLRWIVTGTASLRGDLRDSAEKTFNVPVLDSYGSTEATVIGFSPLPPRKYKRGAVVPCVPELAILDDRGNALPRGATGEIAVRGPQIFGGYEDDPEANAQVFVNGWFRTGDLGLLDGEGYLHLKGRVKDIINKGGEKISPTEIDQALMEHPDVLEVATFPVPHPSLGEDVDAAVVLRPNRIATESELRGFLFDRLAYFKVPTRIFIVKELPKGALGKINRKELASLLGIPK